MNWNAYINGVSFLLIKYMNMLNVKHNIWIGTIFAIVGIWIGHIFHLA